MKPQKMLARVYDKARHNLAKDITEIGPFRRLAMWRRNRKTRAEIAKFQQGWAKLTPHQQLTTYIAIINSQPEFRRALRTALGIQTAQLHGVAQPPSKRGPLSVREQLDAERRARHQTRDQRDQALRNG